VIIAADPGFSAGDVYALGLLFCGLAVFAAVGALSHQSERAFSASVIYLGLGLAAAAALEILGIAWVEPLQDAELVERLSELAIVVALFAAGLRLDRELSWRAWAPVARLLLIAMPLTIGAITLFGAGVMGLSLGAALALGAVLAPTDPVLAGDVGVGPPGESGEDDKGPAFALTGEAGLNDGLAFPFVLLALWVAVEGGAAWLGEWAVSDVLYGIAVGTVLGALVGYGIAGAAVRLRDAGLMAPALDGWTAVATVLVIYGVCEIAGGYGFLGAFVGGVAFRSYERTHEYKQRVHHGAEILEKFGELALILLLGSMVTLAGLRAPGVAGWLLVPVLLLLVRPASVLIATLGQRLPGGRPLRRTERYFVGFFGVRGIGSLYYLAVVAGADALAEGELTVVVWTSIACVLVSIVVHGISADPLWRRWVE